MTPSLQHKGMASASSSSAAGLPPAGRLLPYGDKGMCYFDFGSDDALQRKKLAVLIPGMHDGFCSLSWFADLAAKLQQQGYFVVQPLLRSSYAQFGFRSLSDDVDDLGDLLARVLDARLGLLNKPSTCDDAPLLDSVAIVGHSTGCQIAVRWAFAGRWLLVDGGLNQRPLATTAHLVLQGAVSDREAMDQEGAAACLRDLGLAAKGETNASGAPQQEDDFFPREIAERVFDVPAMSGKRARSLLARLGDDDLFSTDLTDEEISGLYRILPSGIGAPGPSKMYITFVLSPGDEYAALKTEKEYADFLSRYCKAVARGANGPLSKKTTKASFMLYDGSHNGAELGDSLAFCCVAPLLSPEVDASAVPDCIAFCKSLAEQSSNASGQQRPLCIGLVGVPGAGKSTLASLLAEISCGWITVLPMDGFHIPLETLRQEQGAEGVYWRGAPNTFDEARLVEKLQEALSVSPEEKRFRREFFFWPTFDHAKGDPEPDGMKMRAATSSSRSQEQQNENNQRRKIFLLEGLYPLHWPRVRELLDGVILLNTISVDEAVERLKVRNQCIPGYSKEEIFRRCDEVDRSNATVVYESMQRQRKLEAANEGKSQEGLVSEKKLPLLHLEGKDRF